MSAGVERGPVIKRGVERPPVTKAGAERERVAVVGAGWAGLAAAVRATEAGHAVTLFEMALQPGGRARGVAIDGLPLDNGQHILIGAYRRTLDLMRTVGSDPNSTLLRLPLELRYPDGRGLRVPPGPTSLGLARAVARSRGMSWRDRLDLARAALGWVRRGFDCDPALSVAELCADLAPAARELLIDPLCVAALNTRAEEASAQVMLRVLRDALFGGAGASDLLLPRRPLSALLPDPAWQWLGSHGARLRAGERVTALAARVGGGWSVNGEAFANVILACPPTEAARLAATLPDARAQAWAETTATLRYEPIITAYVRAPQVRLPAVMTALQDDKRHPAQFVFDHAELSGTPGLLAFVVSGARQWVDRGLSATAEALRAQSEASLGLPVNAGADLWLPVRLLAEKRATFRCTPALVRAPQAVAPGLWAAGDHVAGPYPATLEGAVRSGEAAAAALARG